MQIKLKTSMAGVTWSARPGDEVTVPDAEGARLIAGGLAEPVRSAIPTPGAETAEAAAAPETAESPRSKKR